MVRLTLSHLAPWLLIATGAACAQTTRNNVVSDGSETSSGGSGGEAGAVGTVLTSSDSGAIGGGGTDAASTGGSGGSGGNGATGTLGTGSGGTTTTGAHTSGGGAGGSPDCPEDYAYESATDTCRPVLTELVPVPASPSDDSLITSLEPSFASTVFTYHVDASFWLTHVAFDLAASEGSTIEVEGQAPEAPVALALGDNEFTVTVTDDSMSSAYSIVVHRRPPLRLAIDSSERRFGHAVAISGEILVVGAPSQADADGLVYTFQRNGPGSWEQQGAPLSGHASFGSAVSADGVALAVGAPNETSVDSERAGLLHFYRHNGDAWNEEQVSDTTAPYFAREIGHSVALSGGSAASASDNVNELYSYVRDSAGVWRESPDGVIAAEDGIAFIEGTVAIDGDWLVVGAHNAGYGPAAFLFTRGSASEAWAAPAAGDSVLQASGIFADSVAIRGRTVVANGEPVRVFERGDDDTWQHSPLPVDSLGALALTNNTLVVGAQQDEYNEPMGGEVNVYRRESGDASWVADPSSPLPADVGEVDAFGWSVATDGRTVVVGAPEEGLSGAIYVYD